MAEETVRTALQATYDQWRLMDPNSILLRRRDDLPQLPQTAKDQRGRYEELLVRADLDACRISFKVKGRDREKSFIVAAGAASVGSQQHSAQRGPDGGEGVRQRACHGE